MIAASFVLGTRWSKVPARVSQFEVNPPPKYLLQFSRSFWAADSLPDGSKIAFVAFTQGKSGTAGVWLRSLESTEARFLPGTEGATFLHSGRQMEGLSRRSSPGKD